MEFLCKVCEGSTIENESEYNNYIDTLHEKSDKSLYKSLLLIMFLGLKLKNY